MRAHGINCHPQILHVTGKGSKGNQRRLACLGFPTAK